MSYDSRHQALGLSLHDTPCVRRSGVFVTLLHKSPCVREEARAFFRPSFNTSESLSELGEAAVLPTSPGSVVWISLPLV